MATCWLPTDLCQPNDFDDRKGNNMDDVSSPAFWWVNQGTTYDEARKRGFIWAPLINKTGRPEFHWDNVSKVKSGDFIFHYSKGHLRAVSTCKKQWLPMPRRSWEAINGLKMDGVLMQIIVYWQDRFQYKKLAQKSEPSIWKRVQ